MGGLAPRSRGEADVLFDGRDRRLIFVMPELVDIDLFGCGFTITIEERVKVCEECSDGSGRSGSEGERCFEI